MPKVTRKSAAAAAQDRPSRKTRPVFGDVSNNSKGRRSSSAGLTKGAAKSSSNTTNPAVSRRRSSRLSRTATDQLGAKKTTRTKLEVTSGTPHSNILQPFEGTVAKGKSNASELVPSTTASTVASRRTRSRKTTQGDNPPNIPSMTGSSSVSTEENPQSSERGALSSEKAPPARETQTSRPKQSRDEPAAVMALKAKPPSEVFKRPTRSSNKRKAAEEVAQQAQADESYLAEDTAQDKKPPAKKSHSSRARAKREEVLPTEPSETSQDAKLPFQTIHASRGRQAEGDEESLPTSEAYGGKQAFKKTCARKRHGETGKEDELQTETALSELPPARRTRASRERTKQGNAAVPTTTKCASINPDELPALSARAGASRGRTRSEEPAAPPAKTAQTSSRASASGSNDVTAKPIRGKIKGKAAGLKSEPNATKEGQRRGSRSSSRATTRKAPAATGKASGKTSAGDKAVSSKRARQNGKTQKSRKSARLSLSKPTSRSKVVAHTKISFPCTDFLQQDEFRLFRGDMKEAPFDPSKFTRGIAPVDLANKDNIAEVTDYVTDIMQRLFDREVSTRPHPYMNEQPTLNTNMRSILIDWLVEVHMKFRLEQSTLYLCVNIIDRYLERARVERSKLQLVGVTSLLVACKIEEIYPPEVRDCVYICDRAYTRQEVLDMEATILRTLEYRVTAPTGYPFLVRFLHITKATKLQKFAANYYMERMLQEYTCLKHRPSLIAASCVTLALNNRSIRSYDRLPDPAPGVPQDLVEYTGFDIPKILDVAEKVSNKVQNTQVTNSRRELIAVRRKYESSRYQSVASGFEDPELQDILVPY